MSILEFMDMSVLECILGCILAMVACLAYSGIGYIFSEKQGIIVQSVIGMTLVGAIVTICAGLCAAAARYFIVIGFILGLIIQIRRMIKREINFKTIAISVLPVFILYLIFATHIFSWIIPPNNIIHYNCHMTYFSGVPLEIVQADYFSRLRIMDVYPYEWSKYHFFNGSYTAIPLLFFQKKNYITYLFAKTLSISFYGGAVFGLLVRKYDMKRAVFHFIIGIIVCWLCAYNSLIWSLATNNYSCVFMLLIAWLLFEKEDYENAIMFSIGLAVTKSGSILCGACLFIYGLIKLYINLNYSS